MGGNQPDICNKHDLDMCDQIKLNKKSLPDIHKTIYQNTKGKLPYADPTQFINEQMDNSYFHWEFNKKTRKLFRVYNKEILDNELIHYKVRLQNYKKEKKAYNQSSFSRYFISNSIDQINRKIKDFEGAVTFLKQAIKQPKVYICTIDPKYIDPYDDRIPILYKLDDYYNTKDQIYYGEAPLNVPQSELKQKQLALSNEKNYIHEQLAIDRFFKFIDVTNEKDAQPHLYITFRKDPPHIVGLVDDISIYSNNAMQIVFKTARQFDEFCFTVHHELGHFKGLGHHHDLKRKMNHTNYAYKAFYLNITADTSNLCYKTIRNVQNFSTRSYTLEIYKNYYGGLDIYPNGVTFIFKPDAKINYLKRSVENRDDGSDQVTLEGNIVCTIDNVNNGDFTDLDFRHIQKFCHHRLIAYTEMFHRQSALPYAYGVTAYLGPDSNITFDTRPQQYIKNDPFSEACELDKNVSTSLTLNNIRNIFASNAGDYYDVDPTMENITFFSGDADDAFLFGGGYNNRLYYGKDNGQDLVEFRHGDGMVFMNYDPDELSLARFDNDLVIYKKPNNPNLIFRNHPAVKIKNYYNTKHRIDIFGKKNTPIKIDERKVRVKPFDISFLQSQIFNPLASQKISP